VKLTFWGTRGSFAKPGAGTVRYGGNTSCVEVETAAGTLLVLDCGTGAHELGQELLRRAQPVRGHLLISHTHWDHIQGLPFFAPLFVPGNRWDVYGPRGLEGSLQGALAGQMQYTYFPVTLDALRAEVRYHDLVEGSFEIGEVRVQTRYLNHPALALGFRLEVDGVTVVYVCDHEPHVRDLAVRPGELMGEDLAHAEFLRGADLVIHDAQYTAGEYPEKAGWGHSTAEYAVRICRAVGVRRLALTHHDPLHDDATIDRMMEDLRADPEARGSVMEVFAAAEGQVFELGGPGARPADTEALRASAASTTIAPSALGAPSAMSVASAVSSAPASPHRALVVMRPSPASATIAEALAADGVETGTQAGVGAAVGRFLAEAPHIVILDGDVDGVAACRAIRSLEPKGGEAAILLVGSPPEPTAGASEWLASPFSVEYARSRIRAWLLRVESRWRAARRPEKESDRLAALYRLALLDSAPEERFDRLTRLAAGLLEAPVTLVTLVDHDRQWFKSRVGTLLTETPRDVSFCAHAILGGEAMIVPDAREDERFADNPIVLGPPHVRFYAGCPLMLPDGHAMGTLCVIDTRPRRLSETQLGLLRDLADLVEEELVRAGSAGAANRAPAVGSAADTRSANARVARPRTP
jgi:phosphoribosyl 1,2-cyclic phosphodiesterase